MSIKKLVITDLDDTLWQWLTTWYSGYKGFIEYLSEHAGVPEEQASEAWAQFYGDGGGIEFPPTADYLIKYTDLTTKEAIAAYSGAISASRATRDSSLIVFDGVVDTLRTLADSGITVVAHTDSPVTAAVHRLHTSGLDGAVKEVYAAPVFENFGHGMSLLDTVDVHVSQWEFKPSTRVLNEIIRYHGVSPENTFYVGDSLRRDMSMAHTAGITGLWAKYGLDYPGRDEALNAVYSVQRYRTFPAEGGLTAAGNGEEEVIALSGFADVVTHVLD